MATLPVTITAAEAARLGSGNAIYEEALTRAKTASRVMFQKDPGLATLVTVSLRVKSVVTLPNGDFEYVFEVPEGVEPTPMLVDDLAEEA